MITDKQIDEIIQGIGQSGKPYYYNFAVAREMDLAAHRIITRVNNFLEVYQRLTGKTISLERLQQLLEQGTNLWNEETYTDVIAHYREKRKDEEQGFTREKILPFFGVDLTDSENVDAFTNALQPLYDNQGYKVSLNDFGYASTAYKMKPIEFGNKFEIKNNELVTTDAHAAERDQACSLFASTPEQNARVKMAVDFIKPFKEMEKQITSKEIISSKSYIREFGLPYPVCIVRISDERKEFMPNPEFVANIKVKQPAKTYYQKITNR